MLYAPILTRCPFLSLRTQNLKYFSCQNNTVQAAVNRSGFCSVITSMMNYTNTTLNKKATKQLADIGSSGALTAIVTVTSPYANLNCTIAQFAQICKTIQSWSGSYDVASGTQKAVDTVGAVSVFRFSACAQVLLF